MSHPARPAGGHLGEKGLHQRHLADTGLPGDDPHLARALAGRGPPLHELGKFRLPADEVLWTTEAWDWCGARHLPPH